MYRYHHENHMFSVGIQCQNTYPHCSCWEGKEKPCTWPSRPDPTSFIPTSNVTICLAMALSTASYICVFWIPKPQKITKASRNCSSFWLKGLILPVFSSILLTSWQTPATIREIKCLSPELQSTLIFTPKGCLAVFL